MPGLPVNDQHPHLTGLFASPYCFAQACLPDTAFFGPMESTGQRILTRNARRNHHNIGPGERLLQAVVGGQEAVDAGDGGDVREVGSDAGGVDDIVEAEVVDEGAGLEEEGEGLWDFRVSESFGLLEWIWG